MIVQTFTSKGVPDEVDLERLGLTDGSIRLSATSLVDLFEGRDASPASGMDSGVREGYERLNEVLSR